MSGYSFRYLLTDSRKFDILTIWPWLTAPGAWQRLVFAAELDADGQARERLAEQLARAPRDREALLQSTSWFQRQGLARLEEQAREVERQERPEEQELWEKNLPAGRQRADAAVELLRLPAFMARRFPRVKMVLDNSLTLAEWEIHPDTPGADPGLAWWRSSLNGGGTSKTVPPVR